MNVYSAALSNNTSILKISNPNIITFRSIFHVVLLLMGGQALVEGVEEEEDLKQDVWAKPTAAIPVEAPLPIEAPPAEPPPEAEAAAGAVQAFGVDITKDEATGEQKLVL